MTILLLLETLHGGTTNETTECGSERVTGKKMPLESGEEQIERWEEAEMITFWLFTMLSIVTVNSVCDLVS